jgi:hypothetical protein
VLRDEPEPDFLPPRLEAPGEFAIFAARSFDMPLSFSASYCFSFLTFDCLPGIDTSSLIVWRMAFSPRAASKTIRELALSLPETYEDSPGDSLSSRSRTTGSSRCSEAPIRSS